MEHDVEQRCAETDLAEVLTPILRARLPEAASADVISCVRTETGYSTETFIVTVDGVAEPDIRSRTRRYVLRRPPRLAILPDYDLEKQFRVMHRLTESDVPVPRVRFFEADPADLGSPYFVMDFVDSVYTVGDVPPYHQAGIFADTDDAGPGSIVERLRGHDRADTSCRCRARPFGLSPSERRFVTGTGGSRALSPHVYRMGVCG